MNDVMRSNASEDPGAGWLEISLKDDGIEVGESTISWAEELAVVATDF